MNPRNQDITILSESWVVFQARSLTGALLNLDDPAIVTEGIVVMCASCLIARQCKTAMPTAHKMWDPVLRVTFMYISFV